MGSQNLSLDEAMRAQMRVHLSLIPLATLVSPLLCQLKFNGGVSSSSSNSNSPSANRNTNNNNRPTDVDEKFFFGGDTPSLTGNQALDGGKAAPATPMEGGGGKLLARMSLEPGSLAGSLVGNNRIVAAAATTASPSTTMDSTATSKTRALTTKTRVSTTKASTARTKDSTRGSTTRTTGGASATTALPSAIRTGTHTGLARGEITLEGRGATPQAGTTTAATSRTPRGSQTIPGPTTLAAIKVDEKFVV